MRCLSDKSKDDGKTPEINAKEDTNEKKKSENLQEKIQELLKSMMAEPKISEAEYREKFATIPDMPKQAKKEEEVTIKMDKIGKLL